MEERDAMAQNNAGESLWWIANILVSILTIAIAFYDGIVTATATWFVLTIILMLLRPD